MSSPVAICNGAVLKLGCDIIQSLTDNNNVAKVCNARYTVLRDELLRSHPWKFALKRVSLAPLDSTPAFGYEQQFQLPPDCLRPFIVNENKYDWTQEGELILTNQEEVQLIYIARVPEAKFDANFSELLSSRIAMDICYKLTQSNPRSQELRAEYLVMLADARSFSAQSAKTEKYIIADDFINVRY